MPSNNLLNSERVKIERILTLSSELSDAALFILVGRLQAIMSQRPFKKKSDNTDTISV